LYNAIVNSPHNGLAVSFAELRSRTKALTATCGLYLSIGGTYEYALAVGSVGTPSHGGMGSHTSLFLMVGCSGSVHARTFTARQEARCEVRLRFVCQPVDTTGARDGSEQQRREIFHQRRIHRHGERSQLQTSNNGIFSEIRLFHHTYPIGTGAAGVH